LEKKPRHFPHIEIIKRLATLDFLKKHTMPKIGRNTDRARRRYTPYTSVQTVARKAARTEIKKLNPLGREVSLAPSSWGTVSGLAGGEVRWIPMGKTIDKGVDQGDRLTNNILYKGIAWHIRIRNSLGTLWSAPLYMRVLVLKGKGHSINPTSTGGYMWESDTDTKTPIDYTANDPNNLDRRVNTNMYEKFCDRRYRITPENALVDGISFSGDTICKGYCKINKRLRYDNLHLTSATGLLPSFYLVWFVQTNSGATIASADMSYGSRFDEYFAKQ